MQATTAQRQAGRIFLLMMLGWLTLGVSTSTAAPSGVFREGDKTIIRVKVFALPDPTRTDTYTRAELEGVKLFYQRFPEIFARRYREKYKAQPEIYGDFNWDNVELRLERFSGIVVERVENDLLAIAGDMAPDVLYVNFRKSDNYISNGFLYPLDKPEDGYLTSMSQEEQHFRIHDKIWPVVRRVGPSGNEHVWAIPYGGALGRVLLYRKDLFDEKNIPYPDNNWTWEQMLDACRKISDPGNDVYGVLTGRGIHESWWWVTFLWSAGGEVMEYNRQTNEWRCTFDSDAAVRALDFYTRLSAEQWTDANGVLRRGYTSKDASDANTKWNEGKIAMMFGYVDEKMFSSINPDVTGMAPVPLGWPDENGNRVRGAELNSRMMGLFAGIKHPAVRDAAWEFIRFYDCEEAVEAKTKVMVEGGLGRFINPRYLRMFGYREIERLSPKGWAETFELAIETGKPEPYGKNSNFAYNMMTLPIQKAEQKEIAGELSQDPDARFIQLKELLEDYNRKANEVMIGIITPEERRMRRLGAAAALLVIVFGFSMVFRKIFRAFTPPKVEGVEQETWGFRRYWIAYTLLIPAVLTILIWHYVPLVRGSVMAFQDYNVMGGSKWVGLDNFGDLLWDWGETGWWMAVWNSLRYATLVIMLTFLPPIILAILLQEVPHGKLFYRTIYYLPAVITGLVTLLLWKMFYTPTEFGTLNRVLMSIPAIVFLGAGIVLLLVCVSFARRLWFHEAPMPASLFVVAGLVLFYTCSALVLPILFPGKEPVTTTLVQLIPRLFATLPEPFRWLSDERTAMIACVIPMVWAGMGPGCLIYLAALKGIPDDFYEAADLDGASFIDKILFVVFPILKPLIIINFIGVFIGAWNSSQNILAMTGGGAQTEVAGLKIFYEAFTFLRMGPATAMAWVLGFMLIGFTVHQLRILSRLEFRTTGDKK